MKIEREYPSFIITKKGCAWVGTGHPWIYAQEIISKSAEPENGALVDALSENGRYLGTGLYSRESKIGLRLISRNANDRFDAEFWKRRIRYAWDYRRTVMGGDVSCCRVIFGEADGFPGLTVDRFSNILVTQTLSVGMERLKDVIFPLLAEVLRESGERIDGIYERNDVAIRALEGLEQGKGWYELPGEEHPQSTVTEICENGIYYAVDFENGQKTGFFLDQKYNRLAVARLAKGRRVLDCFTHTGSFALNAARGGAEHVTAVDVSESAVEMARENARRNGLEDRMDFVAADVFDLLPEVKKGEYDFIILDPPAFTKSRKTVDKSACAQSTAARRIFCDGLVQPFHAVGAVCEDAALRGAGCECRAAADRGAPAGTRPPDTLERPGDGLPEILYFSSCLSLRRTIKRLCTMIRCRAFIN